MKTILLLTAGLLFSSLAFAQMSNGQYAYFSGDWQIKFEVADNGQTISSLELTDLKSHKTRSGKGKWHHVVTSEKSATAQTSSKGSEAAFYEVAMDGEAVRFTAAHGGALMFEFPDGNKVGMKEKK